MHLLKGCAAPLQRSLGAQETNWTAFSKSAHIARDGGRILLQLLLSILAFPASALTRPLQPWQATRHVIPLRQLSCVLKWQQCRVSMISYWPSIQLSRMSSNVFRLQPTSIQPCRCSMLRWRFSLQACKDSMQS